MSIATQHQVCAWVEKPGPDAKIERRDIAVPSPGPGDVLVKLEVTGVCHSDHHSIYGNTPMSTHIAGHEGVGRVIKSMSNQPVFLRPRLTRMQQLDHRFLKHSSTPGWAYRESQS
ncbi:unnamed protein product [Clonostachys solani]|uniref:Alcohol dehydrogenase-like N-terminal domain-containing protein n=1 Tax=Clonostachys solani TaxID=160281 RepID=A0A9P0ELX3_9HYPO|nr:unnamed protein product [Clonostachys solani]